MKKKLLITVAILLFNLAVHAQFVNIPDSGFGFILKRLYPTCFNAAGQMDTTCNQILNATSLVVTRSTTIFPSWQVYNVYSLEGMQYLKNLNDLKIDAAYLTYIPDFPSTLKILTFEYVARLTIVPPLPPGLQRINFNTNYIASLPALPQGLKYLSCVRNNRLRTLPSLPASIQELVLTDNDSLPALPELPADLRGLDWSGNFTSIPSLPPLLKRLRCSSSSLSSLPPFSPGLTYINLFSSNLVTFPDLPAGLDSLQVVGTKITTLPLLPTSLQYLYCGSNLLLTTIQNLPPNLKKLECQNMGWDVFGVYRGFGRITNLPPIPSSLTYLNCSGNHITSISQIPVLMDTLWCSYNRITALPSTPVGKLNSLNCDSNLLTTLPILPKSTRTIACRRNQIQRIASLPDSLRWLYCESNFISELPPLPIGIIRLSCYSNNIYCLPKIPNNPFGNALEITYDAGKIKCIPNYPTQTVMGNSFGRLNLPLCNPTNNPSHCSAFPVISGMVFHDINANGLKDVDEPGKANTRIALSNNNYTITDNNGRYEIGAPDTGHYSISVNAPTYYDAVPSSIQYRFTTYDTLVTGNFPLQANSLKDSAAINLNPGNWAARPGFTYSYVVSWENTGTTTLSPNVVLDYDETRLTYDSSSSPLVVNNGGTLTAPVSNFLPGQRRNFIAYFRIKTTVLRGDSLQATATINNGNVLAKKSFAMIIGGSYDPNDKQGTPALSPTQVANGEYIDYTIRFQNTGTDTAFTVVISDTLSSDLQSNTLELVNASHSCKATVKNNVVFFEFFNILLPDSNVNEPKSHGFVSFKIKPISTIQVNSNINNKAAIYFDYNAPVITNTAVTAIRNPTIPLPLRLMSFTASRSTANTALLEWNTANEINTRQFIIQQSTDGRAFTNCGNEAARAGQYNFYRSTVNIPNETVYLRLKMLDTDGRFTYSPVMMLRKQGIKAPFSILNNPVKGTLKIEVANADLYNTIAVVINTQGTILQTHLLQKSIEQVNVQGLPAGTYILQTSLGSARFVVVQ